MAMPVDTIIRRLLKAPQDLKLHVVGMLLLSYFEKDSAEYGQAVLGAEEVIIYAQDVKIVLDVKIEEI